MGIGLEWDQLFVDAHDPHMLGHWWAEALGWSVIDEDEDEPWVVLASLEGNEFCVLSSRRK